MAYEPRPGDGTLFKADKKSEKAPDFTGNLILHRDVKAGETIRLAAWSKEGPKGWFYSLKASDPMAKREATEKQADPLDELKGDAVPF
jgi:hypothetical protein